MRKSDATQLKRREIDRFDTPTDLSDEAVAEISRDLRQLLADVFALYIKTKNFHWHISNYRLDGEDTGSLASGMDVWDFSRAN